MKRPLPVHHNGVDPEVVRKPVPSFQHHALDHDVFGWNPSKDIVIDSNKIEHDVARKPVPTFRHHALASTLSAFRRDRRGASAVEFAIVSMPFILLVLAILQLGVYFLTQASLDAGVIKTADYLANSYYSGTTPTTLTPSTLQTMVISNSGGLLSTSTLLADLKQFSALGTGAVPIGSAVDANSPGDLLALRAQGTVVSIVPGLSTIYVRSSALLRRQNT